MERPDNYAIQVQQAKTRFLTYDQDALIQKMKMRADERYLYISMLAQQIRISRTSGDMERLTDCGWVDANSHSEVMTLLDLICDSREDRFVSGRWKSMAELGMMFHRDLLEGKPNPWADRFEANPDGFRRACEALGGKPFRRGDVAYTIELFDGLPVLVQLWFGDEEFPASLRFLWDSNTLQYIKYETTYFARGLLLDRLDEWFGRV